MNNLTPYEQSLSEQLSELPLPAEDNMWHEMKKLLEEDKDNGSVVPPPAKRGCGLLSLLLLLAVAITALYFLKPQDWFDKKNNRAGADTSVNSGLKDPSSQVDPNDAVRADDANKSKSTGESEAGSAHRINISPDQNADNGSSESREDIRKDNTKPGSTVQVSDDKANIPATSKASIVNKRKGASGTKTASKNRANAAIKDADELSKKSAGFVANVSSSKQPQVNENNSAINRKKKDAQTKARSLTTIIAATPEGEDADLPITKNANPVVEIPVMGSDTIAVAITAVTDTVLRFDSAVNVKKIVDTTTDTTSVKPPLKKRFHFAAGLAVYQGIPLNGTLDFAVNSAGRKSAITDYIPSIYARFYKDKKWFIQGEFRYGVPQYSKGFTYKEKVVTDSSQNTLTSSYKLHKTYYIQVPFSFNYYIMPGWSVGTGVIYERFTGALSAETVLRSNSRLVNDSLVSFRLVNESQNSAFRKNGFQWLIETQYQWRRFSFGARYAQGLQPYIKYNDPGTNQQVKRKYNSLNLFLRYELWKQKK